MKKFNNLSDSDKYIVRMGAFKEKGYQYNIGYQNPDELLESLKASEVKEYFDKGMSAIKNNKIQEMVWKIIGAIAVIVILALNLYFFHKSDNLNKFYNSIETPDVCSLVTEGDFNVEYLLNLMHNLEGSYRVISPTNKTNGKEDKLYCGFFIQGRDNTLQNDILQFVTVHISKETTKKDKNNKMPVKIDDARGAIYNLADYENFYKYDINVSNLKATINSSDSEIYSKMIAVYVEDVIIEKLPKNSSIEPYKE